ncbi:MAG: hypothetical protein HOV86_14390 [Thermoactinospora sp.]|nr:hypothetical protein [Thermoactinospora sp.]
MFLKVLRVVLIVAGLGVLGFSAYLADTEVENTTQLVPRNVTWDCRPVGTKGESSCEFDAGAFTGSGPDVKGHGEVVLYGMLGLGLLVAAVGVGQFQSQGPGGHRAATAQPVAQPVAGPYGATQQPMAPPGHQAPQGQQYGGSYQQVQPQPQSGGWPPRQQ